MPTRRRVVWRAIRDVRTGAQIGQGNVGRRPRRSHTKLGARALQWGVLVAPPGAGKTVMASALIARRACSTLVLVHRRPLLELRIKRLTELLELERGESAHRPSRVAAASTWQ